MRCEPCQGTGRRWLPMNRENAQRLINSPARPTLGYITTSGVVLSEAELFTVPAETEVLSLEFHCEDCGGSGVVHCCDGLREQPRGQDAK